MDLSFNTSKKLLLLAAALGVLTLPLNAADKRPGDIRSTKHNLSAQSSNTTRANSETEVCVFCHTPHGANTTAPGAPLWNRQLNPASSYALYSSTSFDAAASVGQPSGQSKLCLSCHDGTLAINAVGNMAGSGSGSNYIQMSGQGDNLTPFTMPDGAGKDTGFTREIGVDLTNDHPISFPYSTALAEADGELRDPATNSHIGTASPGNRPTYPLTNGDLQCTSCHDPHVKGADNPNNTADTGNNAKFLRGPRFQMQTPSSTTTAWQPGVFNDTTGNAESGDIVCLACHDREIGAETWAKSAHADDAVADETYTDTAANQREFPTGIKVWQASCLNCHDTHSVKGAKRLLREGTDSTSSPKSGGNAAQEETCFQCHTDGAAGSSILNLPDGTGDSGQNYAQELVPNIKNEFTQRSHHMPLQTADQRNATSRSGTGEELHDITNADFIETKENLGDGNSQYRHAECTDCHNPHRVRRDSRFNSDGIDDGLDSAAIKRYRTHVTGLNETSTGHNDGREGNVASGVLRGAFGVDLGTSVIARVNALNDYTWPIVTTASDFEARSGDPGTDSVAIADSQKHLTREYQLCFKCHSSYSQDYRTSPTSRGRSQTDLTLSGQGGSTTSGTNGLTYYTNVASEFLSVNATNPPTTGTDQGEKTGTGNSAGSACGSDCNPSAINHRSWHPVVFPTGRDRNERGMGAGAINLRPPFNDKVGTQTMQCSDCHGADGSYTPGSGANRSEVQGPHGSNKRFLLKTTTNNPWNSGVSDPNKAGTPANHTRLSVSGTDYYGLCGNCHDPEASSSGSGFYGNHVPDGNMAGMTCMGCHIAVPHGWKNKAFLVNLRCVGKEVNESFSACTGRPSGSVNDWKTRYSQEPYYSDAYLRISTWMESGSWTYESCDGDNMKSCSQ